MTAIGQLVSVRRVNDDVTQCRRLQQPIARGRRAAFVAGTGNVCLRCLVDSGHAGQANHQIGDTTMTGDAGTTAAADGEHDDDDQAEVVTIDREVGTHTAPTSKPATTPRIT
jgi:hypothetical protein